ncbi:YhgE/Pip domain-containing protein [Listeria welshimeri]|uniref:YhgE/Pip domain-containing protein n=1 Tax=Listeria welshimeri TaxID=1643 RepID=UPI001888A7B4|nr:hypothetical protein [Listeria welshimeri]MBF2456566.1 hypothetical protein [Listeria welshimeri]
MLKKVAIGFAFIFVFLLGMFINSHQTEMNTQEKSTTIAIVNLDEGYQESNYAKELLTTMKGDFVLTGLSDAQAGMEDARYAAYVVIDANFSQNVASINRQPQKSLIQYQINSYLDSQTREATKFQLYELEKNLNNNLGYIYIESILNEYHTTQDMAVEILKRDEVNLEILMEIDNSDLISMVDMTDVKRLENTIEQLDLEPEKEAGEAIITDIDTSYKEFLSLSQEQLTTLKTDNTTFQTNLGSTEQAIKAIPTIFKEDGSQAYQLAGGSAYITTINENIQSHISNYNSGVQGFNTKYQVIQNIYNTNNIFEVYDNSRKQNYELVIQSQILDYMMAHPQFTVADAIMHFETTQQLNEDVSLFVQLTDDWEIGNAATLTHYMHYLSEDNKRITRFNQYNQIQALIYKFQNTSLPQPLSTIEMKLDDNTVSEKLTLTNSTILEAKIAEDLGVIQIQQKEAIEMALASYTENKTSADKLTEQMNAYDPVDAIDEEVINAHFENLKKNNESIIDLSQDKNEEYLDLTSNVYSQTSEHIRIIGEDMRKAQESSDKKVETGLEASKEQLSSSNELNTIDLNHIIATLPYTKIGNQENAQVVDFIVDSTTFEIKDQPVSERKEEILIFVIITVGLLFTSTMLVAILMKRNKNMPD